VTGQRTVPAGEKAHEAAAEGAKITEQEQRDQAQGKNIENQPDTQEKK
jgi:hypothetical protein